MKKNVALTSVLMVIFALSRLPGCLPNNFSAAYALMFCAGVYFPGRLVWWLPFSVMLATDLGLDLNYQQHTQVLVFDVATLIFLGGELLGIRCVSLARTAV